MTDQNCGNCRYFNPKPKGPHIEVGKDECTFGNCRRYPMSYDKWSHQWCGEWVGVEEKLEPLDAVVKEYGVTPEQIKDAMAEPAGESVKSLYCGKCRETYFDTRNCPRCFPEMPRYADPKPAGETVVASSDHVVQVIQPGTLMYYDAKSGCYRVVPPAPSAETVATDRSADVVPSVGEVWSINHVPSDIKVECGGEGGRETREPKTEEKPSNFWIEYIRKSPQVVKDKIRADILFEMHLLDKRKEAEGGGETKEPTPEGKPRSQWESVNRDGLTYDEWVKGQADADVYG